MSNIQTGAERMPHDLSHLGFLAGQIGRLITISTTPVIAGDSFEMDAVFFFSSRRRHTRLTCDSSSDVCSSDLLAEDLTAETFFRALRSMHSFRWQGKDFGAWLMTIARNLTADHFKAGRTRLEQTTEDMQTQIGRASCRERAWDVVGGVAVM